MLMRYNQLKFREMRGLLILFLFCIFIILAVLLGNKSSAVSADPDLDVLNGSEGPPTNPPLPLTPKHDTAIVAAPDGTVYLVEVGSGQILWSFSSGPSIYSSYQTLPSNEGEKLNSSSDGDSFYIDCGEDWELYVHGSGSNKVKLPLSAEEFVKRTPFVSTDGGVMLGSKKTAVFLVDAKTGKVIRTFRSDDFPSVGEHDADETSALASIEDVEEWVSSGSTELEDVDKPLYVTRTDYALKYTSTKTGKVLWYLMFADIEASFQCEGIENLLGGLGHKLNIKLPMPCETRPVVYRIRDRSSLESLFMVDKLPEALPGGRILSLPAGDQNTMLEHVDLGLHHDAERDVRLALPTSEAAKLLSPSRSGDRQTNNIDSDNLERSHFLPPVLYAALLPLMMAFFIFARHAVGRVWGKLYKQPEDHKYQSVTTKKKKGRRTGANKHNTAIENKLNNISYHENLRGTSGLQDNEVPRRNFSPKFSNDNNGLVDGRKIGKLLVSNKEIAKGSNGTIVLEGIYDGRPVAVKRLVQTHHDVASKEIQNLIASDQHPNIVRWYGVEYDQDFVYLALERCACSLYDLISSYSSSSQNQITAGDQDDSSLNNFTVQLQWVVGNDKDLKLWKANGYPSVWLLKLMRDIVCGLAHLHELGIVHRDLKPQNVLVIKEKLICAKISDMGISKRLAGDMVSLTKHATGYGSSGWQAPEQLRRERQTRAVDLFSLGCVLFFCMTGGKHPFGESLERDMNIINDQKDLFLMENIPEATDLIFRLVDPNPDSRPRPVEVMQHPLFWNSETRLSFLRDASDRVEMEDRENESELLEALESIGEVALGGKWDEKMDNAFINDIGRYRRYKFDSVRDLLRVIRNKLNHFRELSKEIQGIIGQVPEGFDYYFSSRFPRLLVEVYKVIHRYCAEEETFHRYFKSD